MLKPKLASDQQRAALRTVPATSLTLHESLGHQQLTCGELDWALSGLGPKLTVLRGLQLETLHGSRPLGLAAFSRLQTLTVRQKPGEWGDVCPYCCRRA